MMLLHKLRIAALAAALGLSCASGTGPALPQPVEEPPVDQGLVALNRILVLESQRSDPLGELAQYARDVELEVRLAAVRALGRYPYPEHGSEVTDALIAALSNSSPEVRGLAAFGLGLRKDPASVPALKHFMGNWAGEDPQVCARVVEAAGRLPDEGLHREVMYATDHESPLVREKAARAAALWETDHPDAAVVDNRLANLASRAPAALLIDRWELDKAAAENMEREQLNVIWSALYALARRKSELGRDVYYLWCRADSSVEARIFATRGLASLEEPREEELKALVECLDDRDWRVAVAAARGLYGSKAGPARVALERVLKDHPNDHVKMACIDALGHADKNDKLMVEPTLEQFLGKPNPNLVASTLVALARLGGDSIVEKLKSEDYQNHHRPVVRKAVVLACEFLLSGSATRILDTMVEDEDPYVAYNAAAAYGKLLENGGRARSHELLSDPDNGIRIGALMALMEGPTPEDLPFLATCYDGSSGENSDEIKMMILELVGELPTSDEAERILQKGLLEVRPYIQELAHGLLVEHYRRPKNAPIAYAERRGEVPTLERRSTNPRVRISTEKGDLTFELFPTEAPVHVHNFLTLARNGHYDGLTVHRVVSAFVVQGGDHRGDGNGGLSWRADHEPLRAEFNELPYERGSLGMPRNDDPDSGGSQFFITHMPTPHLDGRYTLFGRMKPGDGDVLDRILEGARIQGVTILGE